MLFLCVKNFYTNQIGNIWNELPDCTLASSTVPSFERSIDQLVNLIFLHFMLLKYFCLFPRYFRDILLLKLACQPLLSLPNTCNSFIVALLSLCVWINNEQTNKQIQYRKTSILISWYSRSPLIWDPTCSTTCYDEV